MSGSLIIVKQSEWNIRKRCSERKWDGVTEHIGGNYWKGHILGRPWFGVVQKADKQTLIDLKLSYLKYNIYDIYMLISNTIRKLLSIMITHISRY